MMILTEKQVELLKIYDDKNSTKEEKEKAWKKICDIYNEERKKCPFFC